MLPVGELTKHEVRRLAAEAGLRTAQKPDSQDVCFISRDRGREGFLGTRIPLKPGRLLTTAGQEVGKVPALELVTVGQRRGLGLPGPRARPERRYVVDVDIVAGTATVGVLGDLLVDRLQLHELRWPVGLLPVGARVQAQLSAHGQPVPAEWQGAGALFLFEKVRRVAPGQAVVLYDDDTVVGGGVAR